MGVILGIYRYERESESEFKSWCEDIPGECARDILDEWWKRGQQACILGQMNEFIRKRCPEWADLRVG